MSFLNDLKDLIVDDPSINALFTPANGSKSNIYFQLLPKNIDKLDQSWCRWGFNKNEDFECMGGGLAYQSFTIFVDSIDKTLNDLPAMSDLIVEKLNKKSYGGIMDIKFINDVYTRYQEQDIYVVSCNFSATYK